MVLIALGFAGDIFYNVRIKMRIGYSTVQNVKRHFSPFLDL